MNNYFEHEAQVKYVDGLLTNIVEDNDTQLVKVVAWYDNEYGYTAQMLRTAKKMFQ